MKLAWSTKLIAMACQMEVIAPYSAVAPTPKAHATYMTVTRRRGSPNTPIRTDITSEPTPPNAKMKPRASGPSRSLFLITKGTRISTGPMKMSSENIAESSVAQIQGVLRAIAESLRRSRQRWRGRCDQRPRERRVAPGSTRSRRRTRGRRPRRSRRPEPARSRRPRARPWPGRACGSCRPVDPGEGVGGGGLLVGHDVRQERRRCGVEERVTRADEDDERGDVP